MEDLSWYSSYSEESCQLGRYAERFLKIIPREIESSQKLSPQHFTRKRKLPFPKLITLLLSIVSSGKAKGVDVKSGEFFRAAKRSGLWPEAEAVHHSALSKVRQKVHWHVFQDMLNDAVKLAYECWPQDPRSDWHGMPVCAIDGSKYNLPATAEIRSEFDSKSGLDYPGKGHYPQCLVSTLYDVFRRLPIARTVVPANSSEREEVKSLLKFLPSGRIVLFDRGYPSYELIRYLIEEYAGYFVFRCPAHATFPAVHAFIASGKEEDEICIAPL
ncbi:MAG: transposase [Desulfomonilaceae bacterium]